MEKLFKIIKGFFEELSSKPKVGGLQITDSSIQYVLLEKEGLEPVIVSVHLPPGIVKNGVVVDDGQFLKHLKRLRGLITTGGIKEDVRVVVCLPSAVTYTQYFSIPNVGRDRLEESVNLNLQMISPIPAENAYMSWEVLQETEDKYELLGAFAEKQAVDKFKAFLVDGGFQPIIMEFPSLALSWVLNEAVGLRRESILILNVSSDGINLFLLRNGLIYFDYFRSWQSIQGVERQISKSAFYNVVIDEIRKVINFSSSRFAGKLERAFFVAPGLEGTVKEVIESNFGLKAEPLKMNFGKLGPGWYMVLGSAIRGSWNRKKDKFISLGTGRVEDIFYREQIISFIHLWRNILASSLVMFLMFFGSAALLLKNQPDVLNGIANTLNVELQREELSALEVSVLSFNELVTSVGTIKKVSGSVPALLEEIKELSDSEKIILEQVKLGSTGERADIIARAPDYKTVVDFKEALVSSNSFSGIDLPLSKIVTREDNTVGFEITFNIAGGEER